MAILIIVVLTTAWRLQSQCKFVCTQLPKTTTLSKLALMYWHGTVFLDFTSIIAKYFQKKPDFQTVNLKDIWFLCLVPQQLT